MKNNKKEPFLQVVDATDGERLIKYYKAIIPQQAYEEKVYECKVRCTFARSGQSPVSDVLTQSVITARKIEYRDKFEAIFRIIAQESEGINEEVMEFGRLADLLAQPLREVSICTDKKGGISSILNEEQIFQEWIKVREILKEQFEGDKFAEEIREKGFADFYKPLKLISRQRLYALFYLPLFREYVYGSTSSFSFEETSGLLKGAVLDCGIKEEGIEIDVENKVLKLAFSGKAYNEKQLAKTAVGLFDFDPDKYEPYRYTLTVNYHLAAEGGYPLWIEAISAEEIPGLFTYNCHMQVQEATELFLQIMNDS